MGFRVQLAISDHTHTTFGGLGRDLGFSHERFITLRYNPQVPRALALGNGKYNIYKSWVKQACLRLAGEAQDLVA